MTLGEGTGTITAPVADGWAAHPDRATPDAEPAADVRVPHAASFEYTADDGAVLLLSTTEGSSAACADELEKTARVAVYDSADVANKHAQVAVTTHQDDESLVDDVSFTMATARRLSARWAAAAATPPPPRLPPRLGRRQLHGTCTNNGADAFQCACAQGTRAVGASKRLTSARRGRARRRHLRLLHPPPATRAPTAIRTSTSATPAPTTAPSTRRRV